MPQFAYSIHPVPIRQGWKNAFIFPMFFGRYLLPFEASPLARLNEAGPVEWMAPVAAFQHRELGLAESFSASDAVLQPGVIGGHHLACHAIAHRPQAHDQGLRAGEKEGPAKPVNTFAILDFPKASLARRKGHNLGSPQVQAGRFERRQHATIASAVQIGLRQGKSGPQQRVIDLYAGPNGSRLEASVSRLAEEKSMRGNVQNAGSIQLLERRLGRLAAGENFRLREE